MVIAGHLQEKKGLFYIVLNCKDEEGKRKPKWIPTGLTDKGNKKKAEGLLLSARQNLNANPIEEEQIVQVPALTEEVEQVAENDDQTLFSDFMLDWLEMTKHSVELVTYISYSNAVKGRVAPYFKENGVTPARVKASSHSGVLPGSLKRMGSQGEYYYLLSC